ncbi:hypothetical protein [Bradyrhizobium sp. NBAIM01]|uniref:hypothetical protein n=1 Tax=Bradyrhizobium sp. NBAIM01 TaxID=2793818 RepID=UPI001CD6ABC9|nr:hypothetical protein [Bradyrhizobium sp. NBAIM01]MCA1510421.1 hypothetical protein [Bradyrhizobium sp. NBAIM01]
MYLARTTKREIFAPYRFISEKAEHRPAELDSCDRRRPTRKDQQVTSCLAKNFAIEPTKLDPKSILAERQLAELPISGRGIPAKSLTINPELGFIK